MRETPLPFTDLMTDTHAWHPWHSREEVAPTYRVDEHGGPGGRAALMIRGTGNAHACGCWRMPLPGLQAGRIYRLEAAFLCQGVEAPGKSVRAILTCGEGQFFAQLDPAGKIGDWHQLRLEWVADTSHPNLTVQLFLAWSEKGSIRWSDVRLFDLTSRIETGPRVVRLAAVSGNPTNPVSPAECLDFYAERMGSIEGRVDLVCLPELINSTCLPGDPLSWAEPIPGPTSERLSGIALARGCYIAASLLERQGRAVYNTGLLIDRNGGLVGKYRKAQLTLGEGLLRGCTPGEALSVFHTDFGIVAMMICYDGHFPEVARILSLKGAQVILFPNMNDSREGGSVWESVVRTRAVDNQVHIVAAVNGGRSCVVSPKGELLSMTDRTPGSIAIAECDLATSLCDFSKRPIHRRYDQLRRADLFGDLEKHVWDKSDYGPAVQE
jgi:predicted amidohydrolase